MPKEPRKRPGTAEDVRTQRKRQRSTVADGPMNQQGQIENHHRNNDGNQLRHSMEVGSQAIEMHRLGQATKDIEVKLAAVFQQMREVDSWPEEFAKQIDEAEVALVGKLREGIKERAGRQERFQECLLDILGQTIAHSEPTDTKNLHGLIQKANLEMHPLFISSRNIVFKARNLLDDYNGLVENTERVSETTDLNTKFKVERERLEKLIRTGKKVTVQQINTLLEASRSQTAWNPFDQAHISQEDSLDLEAMMHAGWKKLDPKEHFDNERWGDAAYEALQAMRDLDQVARRGGD